MIKKNVYTITDNKVDEVVFAYMADNDADAKRLVATLVLDPKAMPMIPGISQCPQDYTLRRQHVLNYCATSAAIAAPENFGSLLEITTAQLREAREARKALADAAGVENKNNNEEKNDNELETVDKSND